LAVDGCFRLPRLKKKAPVLTDPLNHLFFHGREETLQHVSSPSNATVEGSECTALRSAAQLKGRHAHFDETGVIGLFCARHGTPLAMVDCFHGERYSYVDFLLMQYVANKSITKIMFYYDVACNYRKHALKIVGLLILILSNKLEFTFYFKR